MEKQHKFNKNVIIKSKTHFSGAERDILSVLLKNDTEYTIEECKAALEKEAGRKVK